MLKHTLFAIMSCALVGCGAINKQIRHGNLDVQTKMSSTIFLEPVGPAQKVVYLQLRNTTDQADIPFREPIAAALQHKGYTITTDPAKATFILKANILSVAKVREDEEAWALLTKSLTNTGVGAATGIGAAIALGHKYRGAAAGGLLGAGIENLSDALVEVITYAMATDIQLVEKHKGVEKVHPTRVVSIAKKTNLEFKEAAQALSNGLVKSISGMFE